MYGRLFEQYTKFTFKSQSERPILVCITLNHLLCLPQPTSKQVELRRRPLRAVREDGREMVSTSTSVIDL